MGNIESNKKMLIVGVIAVLVVLAITIIITLFTHLIGFCIVLSTLFVILVICLSIYMRESPDEYAIFIKEKKRILKTYDSVIVEVETLPNIAGKNIIKVKTFDDLVDAQLELREPIYYKNDNDSCFFLLLHYNEACVFILKINDEVISPTEQSIRFMKPSKTDSKSDYENMLENLEDTVVYKFDELRSFKISPIRNKKKVELKDDKAIKDVLEHTTQLSREMIESELSKTQYLKDLKKKVLEADGVVIPAKPRPKKVDLKAKKEEVPPVKEVEESKEIKVTEKVEKPKEEKTKNAEIKETAKAIEKELNAEDEKKEAKPKKKKSPAKAKATNTHAARRSQTYKKKK